MMPVAHSTEVTRSEELAGSLSCCKRRKRMKPTFFVLSIFGLLASVHSAWADAFLLSNGIFTTINVPGASGTAAAGINSLGQIVETFAAMTGPHGFLDTNGGFTKID